jgi:hypothetical protein
MVDLLPKDRDGKPLGKLVEIEYDVVDLPAWNFDHLVGGPVLRAVLGILKNMMQVWPLGVWKDVKRKQMKPCCEY